MCQEAIIANKYGKHYVNSIGDLAKAMGIKVVSVPILQDHRKPRHNECLCGVDFVRLGNLRDHDVV